MNQPPVQVSKDAKDANNGAQMKISMIDVVPVIIANNNSSSRLLGLLLLVVDVDDDDDATAMAARLATMNIDNSQHARGTLIYATRGTKRPTIKEPTKAGRKRT